VAPYPYETEFPSLDLDRPEDGILRLTLRAPGRLNAVSEEQHGELARVWQAIGQDSETRAVLVRGADGAFSSGGDLDLVLAIADDAETRRRVFHEARDLVYNLLACPTPIVSAITGPAVGAGLVVGLLADVSLASPQARIVDGHTRLGVAAGDHAAIVWPLLCEDRALEIARRLAAGSRSAITHTKTALNEWLLRAGPIFDASLELEFLDMTGPDVREGVAAIREKRAPRFS
jgi:enoyl-CoA hydratase